jgi:hypothetical protein
MQNSLPQPSSGPANAPPTLGAQVPGVNSEMPAQAGLSAYFNPMAQQLQSYGRNGDTMLIHMAPEEVKGLQQLAMATGGSLTINPHTGLPEAGWLKKLLPTILGFALNFIPGVGPLMSAAIVGAGYTAATGSLKKGLMAGLSAYGGAGIGAGVAKLGTAAAGTIGKEALGQAAAQAGGQTAMEAAKQGIMNNLGASWGQTALGQAGAQAGTQVAGEVAKQGIGQAVKSNIGNFGTGLKALANTAMSNPIQAAKDFGGGFSGAVKADPWLKSAPFLQKLAPTVAGTGAFSGITSAMQPDMPNFDALQGPKDTYEGPYVEPLREVSYPDEETGNFEGGGEHMFFTPSNPVPGAVPLKSLSPEQRKRYGFADGGLTALPASEEFKNLVAFYNASSPGAVKASLTYPKKVTEPKTTTETPPTTTPATEPKTTTPATEPKTTTGDGDSTVRGTGRGGVYYPNTNVVIDTSGRGATSQIEGWGTQGSGVGSEDSILFQNSTGPHSSEVNALPSSGAAVRTGPMANYGLQDNSSLNDIIYDQLNKEHTRLGVTPEMLNAAANNMFGTTGVNYYAQPATGSQSMGGNSLSIDSGVGGGGGLRFEDLGGEVMHRRQGGHINMGDGSFVVDARTVAELGNGSSNAGIELLRRMGGHPVQGPGDGVSDSVPARIGGRQEARVARDEVIFPPQAVNRLGRGSNERGADKLYALMNKAKAARKRAGRGEDTKLRRSLA